MGLFALVHPSIEGSPPSSRDYARAAIANLKLFAEAAEHHVNLEPNSISSSGKYPSDYLLKFAESYIGEAWKTYIEECDNNPAIRK